MTHKLDERSTAEEWSGGHPAKITALDGDLIFEGNIDMFRDCFFDNADWDIVVAWAKAEGFTVELCVCHYCGQEECHYSCDESQAGGF